MAASRKYVNYSISCGSAEDFEHSCVPCLSDGQHLEACAFCVECDEHLCNTCLQCHRKTKASKHHQLLTGKIMNMHLESAKTTEVIFEKCATHNDAKIKFYCNQHDFLGCSECFTHNHKKCDLDYLPEKCKNIDQEYTDIRKKLKKKLSDAEDVMQKAEYTDNQIEESYVSVVEKINIFREEIDNQLDAIQKKTETNACEMKAKNEQKVKDVTISCEEYISEMEKLQTSLRRNNTRKQICKLFLNIQKAKSTLQSEEVQNVEKSLYNINTQFSMECYSKDFSKVFLVQSFGDLKELSTVVETPSPRADYESNLGPFADKANVETPNLDTDFKLNHLNYEGHLDVRSGTDVVCNIIACAVVSPDKLVLADDSNDKIKLVDLTTNTVTDEVSTDRHIHDVTALPGERVAVTVGNKVTFVSASEKLEIYNITPLISECRGISYNGNSLYVVCLNPDRIIELDVYGVYKQTISLNFEGVDHITTSPDHKFLYLSYYCITYCKNVIVRKTTQGEESVFSSKQIRGPLGMKVLDDGSVLVCSFYNQSIHHIDADFKHGRRIDGVHNPQGIGYNKTTRKVYVCLSNSNKLTIFSVQ
ncbi:uncharacterized protein LOC128559420 [Mercenaria mercenaria]|uniref:uncharacterized protein LOC128559420 n=1 Tax=Mercenaria mercenaria TaxID=6596 RepID=UPI00234F9C2E|nr:uncharacterized protein LOC128559420 [Mercenaria mercenaria]